MRHKANLVLEYKQRFSVTSLNRLNLPVVEFNIIIIIFAILVLSRFHVQFVSDILIKTAQHSCGHRERDYEFDLRFLQF